MRVRANPWTRIDLGAKSVLVALLLFSVTHSDWDRFADKAMVARAVLYPALVGLLPLGWWIHRHRTGRPISYPGAAGLLFTLPFVIDIGGNALDLYDRIDVFDDACHLLNWALMCSAAGLVLLRMSELPAWTIAALCVGFGATVAISWEIGEYATFILDTPEASTAYRDTIGDLTLGLCGSILAGVVFGFVAGARQRGDRTPSRQRSRV